MNEVARGEQLSQDGMNSPGFRCTSHFMATQFPYAFSLLISQFEDVFFASLLLTAYSLLVITGLHIL